MRVLIYDVETAQTSDIGSICSVGWILLDNDSIVDEGYSLIDPHCSFSKTNIAIHGITAKDVAGSPCFADYWNSTLKAMMTTSLVIAHSANFDMSATEQALFKANIQDPGIDYLDSLPLIKAFVKASSYKLVDLASLSDYQYNAHNAMEDVHALLHVLCYVRDKYGYEDIASMIVRSPVRAENTKFNHYIPKQSEIRNRYQERTHCTEEVTIIDDCLLGKKVCITGDIPGYERSDIERMIMEHSGNVVSSVSGKTDYLIVGIYIDPRTGVRAITSKQKKAVELMEKGEKVQILTFDTFTEMISKQS